MEQTGIVVPPTDVKARQKSRQRRLNAALSGKLTVEQKNKVKADAVARLVDRKWDSCYYRLDGETYRRNPKTGGAELLNALQTEIAVRTELEIQAANALDGLIRENISKSEEEKSSEHERSELRKRRETARGLVSSSMVIEAIKLMDTAGALPSSIQEFDKPTLTFGELRNCHDMNTRVKVPGRGFANKHMSIINGELVARNRNERWFDTKVLKYDYIEEGEPELLLRAFSVFMGHDAAKVDRLCEIVGMCVYRDNFLQKWVIFQGEGGAGKGLTCDIISGLFNSLNDVFSPRSMELLGKDFGLQGIVNKEILIMQEAGKRPTSRYAADYYDSGINSQKQVTGGGTWDVAVKGKGDKSIECNYVSVTATNYKDLMVVDSPEDRKALERRMVVTQFVSADNNKTVVDELTEVLFENRGDEKGMNRFAQFIIEHDTKEVIASYCLRKFAEAVKRGVVAGSDVQFSADDVTSILMEELTDLGRTEEEEFIESYLDTTDDETAFVTRDELFEVFKNAHDLTRINKRRRNDLLSAIRASGKWGKSDEGQISINGVRKRGFYSMKINGGEVMETSLEEEGRTLNPTAQSDIMDAFDKAGDR